MHIMVRTYLYVVICASFTKPSLTCSIGCFRRFFFGWFLFPETYKYTKNGLFMWTIRLNLSKYKKSYRLVFPYENKKNYTFWHAFWDLIFNLLNLWEFDQYFNNHHFFNSWELMVKYSCIERWTYKWGWYLNIRSWSENSQSYSKYSPILIESIFHCNIQITKNLFS
jgi:hypothetical protein